MERRFILASGSPRRREILDALGFEYEIITTNAEENVDTQGMTPEQTVRELADAKGRAVAQSFTENRGCDIIIISADTVVVSEGKILGKPKDRQDAKQMLMKLSGGKHSVLTGLCLWQLNPDYGSKGCTVCAKTDVYFKELSEEMIEAYLDTGEYTDKAGGYGIQEMGALLVDKIDGDYFNVVGFPVNLFYELIRKECNIDVYQCRVTDSRGKRRFFGAEKSN